MPCARTVTCSSSTAPTIGCGRSTRWSPTPPATGTAPIPCGCCSAASERASVRAAVLGCGRVDLHRQLPPGDALLVGEAPAVGGLDDDVVVLAAVQPLRYVLIAGEGREELAVDRHPARRV